MISEKYESVKAIIDEIQDIRVSLIPAYAEDEDEFEKGVEDYLEFYAQHPMSVFIEAVGEIIANHFLSSEIDITEETLEEYWRARNLFCATFPFCYDEFAEFASKEELQPYKDWLRTNVKSNPLNRELHEKQLTLFYEYKDLLLQLEKLL